MKRISFTLLLAVLFGCSSPKYASQFRPTHTDYRYGELKQSKTVPAVDPGILEASIKSEPAIVTPPASVLSSEVTAKSYTQMSKQERKAFRKELKAEIKKYVKSVKNQVAPPPASGGMDHDLKLALIFGAIGIVSLIIGGNVFWIVGGILLIIGVIFLVKWLIRQ
jgi:uncharacterized membrane protein